MSYCDRFLAANTKCDKIAVKNSLRNLLKINSLFSYLSRLTHFKRLSSTTIKIYYCPLFNDKLKINRFIDLLPYNICVSITSAVTDSNYKRSLVYSSELRKKDINTRTGKYYEQKHYCTFNHWL